MFLKNYSKNDVEHYSNFQINIVIYICIGRSLGGKHIPVHRGSAWGVCHFYFLLDTCSHFYSLFYSQKKTVMFEVELVFFPQASGGNGLAFS